MRQSKIKTIDSRFDNPLLTQWLQYLRSTTIEKLIEIAVIDMLGLDSKERDEAVLPSARELLWMVEAQRVLDQLATSSLGSNPAQGQAAQGMSVVDEAQEEGSAASSSTERPSDKLVVCLQADTASLRTKQRKEFKSMLKKKGILSSRVSFQNRANKEPMPLICNSVAVGLKKDDQPCQCKNWPQ